MSDFNELFAKYGLIVLVVLICVFFISYGFSRKSVLFYFRYVAVCLMVFLAVFSGMNIYQAITVRGGEHGELSPVPETNQVSISELSFDFKNVMMTKKADGIYSAMIEKDKVMKLDADSNYLVFVNDVPCNYKVHSDDYIVADYSNVFYDKNFNEIENATLTFKIKFDKHSTLIILESTGDDDTVKLWNDYFNKEDFNFTIKDSEDDAFIYDKLFNIDLEVAGKTYKTIKVISDYEYELPQTVMIAGYQFKGWKLNGQSITKVSNVTSDITITADLTKIHTVTLKNGNEVLRTEEVLDGDSVTLENLDPQDVNDYYFNGWKDSTGKYYTRFIPTSDITLNAEFKKFSNVVFHLNIPNVDVNSNIYKVQRLRDGEAVTIPSDPTRTHYSFIGWTEKSDSTTVADITNLTLSNGAIKYLYAVWQAEGNFPVTINKGDLNSFTINGSNYTENSTINFVYNNKIIINLDMQSKYNFEYFIVKNGSDFAKVYNQTFNLSPEEVFDLLYETYTWEVGFEVEFNSFTIDVMLTNTDPIETLSDKDLQNKICSKLGLTMSNTAVENEQFIELLYLNFTGEESTELSLYEKEQKLMLTVNKDVVLSETITEREFLEVFYRNLEQMEK